MKKRMICLLVGIMSFGIVACGNKSTEVSETADDTPTYKELVDPRGKMLEDTSTGESNPQLIETKYETKDVVVADYVPTEMGYAVDPTGQTDSTQGLQDVLFDCYKSGGGTVFLPAGNYAISETVYIPPFVTLRGDWQDPDSEDFDGDYGTIISVWMESEDEDTAGAFKIGGSAGAIGLTVYYPMQTMDCIIPYPYAFFVDGIGPNGMLQTVRDVTMINAYRGIGTAYGQAHEQLQLENIRGTFLDCGLYMNNSSDVGTVRNVSVSNKYWKEASADCMNAVSGTVIDDYTRRYTTGIEISDIEWTEFNNISIDGCNKGIHTVLGSRVAFAGSLYDVSITNCEQGIVSDHLDERWGAVLARSYVEGGITNNSNGKWKLCDVEVKGELVSKEENSILVDEESDLSSFEIDYEDSYVKPVSKLFVADISNGLFTDAAADLQSVLDEAHEAGGGVVYVPAGVYRFHSPVVVPTGVELRGSSSVATRDQATLSLGTMFYCYYGDDAEHGATDGAFITLAGENAGMNGIRVIYPENSTKSENINTTYTVRGEASGVYVVNCAIVASAYGVDFRGCDNHYIEGVMTSCYYNALYLGGTGGNVNRCLQNGTVMQRTGAGGLKDWVASDELFGELIEPVLRVNCEYIMIEDAKEQLVYDAFAYGCKTAITNKDSENTLLVNIGNDNINASAPQIYVKGGSLTGINILRYNGYSYELEEGALALYTRIGIGEIGEQTVVKNK